MEPAESFSQLRGAGDKIPHWPLISILWIFTELPVPLHKHSTCTPRPKETSRKHTVSIKRWQQNNEKSELQATVLKEKELAQRRENSECNTKCLAMSEQHSCQEHLCHYGGTYKEVNLDSIVRKLSNSVQMSARVILLSRSYKDRLGQPFHGFEKPSFLPKRH